MESVHDIKEALSARSRTATLDELANEGRKKVRLIRAEHVASMISEAVHAAIEQSGLIAPEAAEQLVEKSRQEFRSILRQREQEQQQAHANEVALAQRDREIVELQARLAELSQALAATRQELDAARAESEQAHAATTAAKAAAMTAEARAEAAQTECDTAQAVAEAARTAVAAANAAAVAVAPQPAAAAGPSTELLFSLVQEMATLKANLLHAQSHPQPQAVAPTPAQPAMPDFASALEKLTGSLTDRLEMLGKKMGVSAAVSGDAPVDFGGLFKDTGKSLESNMDNIEVKQKAAGGIAGNLARLKKLKGGG